MNDCPERKIIETENLPSAEVSRSSSPSNTSATLRGHWPEYLMEAGEIGFYLFFVCTFATLLQHPSSPIRHFVHSSLLRRALQGFLVGSTVVAIVMTPWGKRSGGHFNPAITLAFYRLGKLAFWDMLFYVSAQFVGATVGVGMAAYVLGGAPRSPSVRYAVTAPGIFGNLGALVGELVISSILMMSVLIASNRAALARYTPYLAGTLYAMFITFESPLSGMSMNPARTFGSAFHADYWQAFWVYVVAPTVGMLASAEIFLWARGGIGPYCAKLHHANDARCIFRHGYRTARVQDFFQGAAMSKWKLAIPVLAIALVAAWYAFRPERLVTNVRVDEALPVAGEASSPQAIESGTFSGVMHPTTGTATIYRLADGTRLLRFTNFKTSNGPDVHVYLIAASDAKDSATVVHTDFIDLGTIKGNIGDQNYALAPEMDLTKYRTVSIWCKRFSVNFGAAPLSARNPKSQGEPDN